MPVFPGDLLEVHNLSEAELRLTWDGRSVTIAPHKKRAASFEQVVNHFGHPYAGVEERKIADETGNWHVAPTREDERARISVKGGWDLGSSKTGGLQVLGPPPAVEVYDLDGERVWTVLEDPTGEHSQPRVAEVEGNNSEQISRLEKQLRALKMQVEANARDLAVPDSPAHSDDLPDLDVPVDE
jgi:hypothetical protein